ncbi:MAG: hypothetical protein GSR85_01285 [Desulfurococcales archaeon]|nr:hypothetical protein [Desulfurococcales archaeon]
MPIVRVSYLGPKYSFTYEAAQLLYPQEQLIPADTIRSVVSLVESGKADVGVIPLENSLHGPVAESIDALADTMLHINAIVEMRVTLVVAGDPGISRIYGHPHALAEASRWLDANLPEHTRIATSSTSSAAIAAREEGGLCVCSRSAAEALNLNIIAEGVESGDNYTRFAFLSWSDSPKGAERTSIMALIPDVPGGLYRFLEPYASNNVNLTMIYSRPTRGKPWRYVFYIEMEGSRLNERVNRALRESRERSLMLKILGSYRIMKYS